MKAVELKVTHSFKNGVQVSKSKIKKWHSDVLRRFSEDDSREYTHTRSGNSMVFGKRNLDTGEIEIYEVTSGYEFFQYEPKNTIRY
jgi:hypothetical protein